MEKKIHAKEKYNSKLDSEVYLSIRSNSTGALAISINPLNAKDKNKKQMKTLWGVWGLVTLSNRSSFDNGVSIQGKFTHEKLRKVRKKKKRQTERKQLIQLVAARQPWTKPSFSAWTWKANFENSHSEGFSMKKNHFGQFHILTFFFFFFFFFSLAAWAALCS